MKLRRRLSLRRKPSEFSTKEVKLRWEPLYKAALAENDPLFLKTRLRAAEVAMTRAAQQLLNTNEATQEYAKLMAAMRTLYEHALRKGVNLPGGTFKAGR